MLVESMHTTEPIRLWLDHSDDSKEALRLARMTGREIVTSPASGYNIPMASLGPEGLLYTFLSGIKELVADINPEVLQKMDCDITPNLDNSASSST